MAKKPPRKIGLNEAFNPLFEPKTSPKTKGYKPMSKKNKSIVDPKTGRRRPAE